MKLSVKSLTFAAFALCCATAALFGLQAQEAQPVMSAADRAQAIRDFNTTCAGCHGDNAGGGDRAPALIDNAHLRTLDTAGIESIIRNGQRAMPPFPACRRPN